MRNPSAESTAIRKNRANVPAKDNKKPKGNGHSPANVLDPELLLTVLTAVKKGDFSGRFPSEHAGMTGRIYEALNEIIERNDMLTAELSRVSEVVGKEGKISQRAALANATGGWSSCIDSVNTLITDLAQPTTEVARVIGAVAQGDLSQNFNLEVDDRPLKGEFLRTGTRGPPFSK